MNVQSYTAIIIIAGLIVLTAAIMIIRNNRDIKKQFDSRVIKGWGKEPKFKQTSDEFECISHFFRDRSKGKSDFDRIFKQMNAAFSSPGEDTLYTWLRTPQTDNEVLSEREKMIRHFSEDTDGRRKVLRILNDIGRMKKMSMYDYIRRLSDAEKIGTVKYIVLCILMCVGIVMLFIHPVAALAILIPVIVANIAVYLRQKDRTEVYIKSFSCVLKLAEAADKLSACDDEIVSSYRDELKNLTGKLTALRRGAFFVTTSGSNGTGLGDALLEYFKILFHIDLIKFDQMITAYRGNEDVCMRIFEIAGGLDAAIAVASWREYLGNWCEPELTFAENGFLEVADMYHPLISEPVPVTYSGSGGNLITGSNASGKSTFLKETAIASILAQSVHTVPAGSYRASFFRTYTSMALRDDIDSGESYFIVEIRSLKRILDAAQSEGAPVLGIVDEVLRGTNTIERISASSQILRRLTDTNAVIFAATHDIELSYILEKYYNNYHFTEQITDGDVRFDYVLREGRATSRNAIALLTISGYGEDISRAAREQAERFEQTGEWRL